MNITPKGSCGRPCWFPLDSPSELVVAYPANPTLKRGGIINYLAYIHLMTCSTPFVVRVEDTILCCYQDNLKILDREIISENCRISSARPVTPLASRQVIADYRSALFITPGHLATLTVCFSSEAFS